MPTLTGTFARGCSALSGRIARGALDVDPEHNVCCKCLGAAAMHPVCARPSAPLADRMAMPSCWVRAFELFGFYWLGRDELEDTMHFEFLGDPNRIRYDGRRPP